MQTLLPCKSWLREILKIYSRFVCTSCLSSIVTENNNSALCRFLKAYSLTPSTISSLTFYLFLQNGMHWQNFVSTLTQLSGTSENQQLSSDAWSDFFPPLFAQRMSPKNFLESKLHELAESKRNPQKKPRTPRQLLLLEHLYLPLSANN